jgi:catechol 2,3-dioxygenase-like lactoylglutathione lyase family enzyme
MDLAKPALDLGLFTTRPEALRAFWEGEVGLAFNHILPIGPAQKQHRFDLPGGSVLKVNAVAELPPSPPSGYRELIIIREGLSAPEPRMDPDGNQVTLAPPGYLGMGQIGVLLHVRDLAAAGRYYGKTLGLPPGEAVDSFRAGQSLIQLVEDPDATGEAAIRGPGWRYATLQIFDCAAEHAAVLARGGREGAPPFRAGEVAIFSMVRDPDGNWLELSQRASIVGKLAPQQ